MLYNSLSARLLKGRAADVQRMRSFLLRLSLGGRTPAIIDLQRQYNMKTKMALSSDKAYNQIMQILVAT